MSDSSKVREKRFKNLLGIVLLSELMTGKRNLLNLMLDKGTTIDQDRKALDLPPLPGNSWKGLDIKSQLRKARLESAILALSGDRKIDPTKKLVYRDSVYQPEKQPATQKTR